MKKTYAILIMLYSGISQAWELELNIPAPVYIQPQQYYQPPVYVQPGYCYQPPCYQAVPSAPQFVPQYAPGYGPYYNDWREHEWREHHGRHYDDD